jgi:outer membrane protein TolC
MADRERDDNGLLNYMVTMLETMRETLASKDDIAGLATRDELRQVEARLSAEITAVRGDVEQVQLRLTSIEKALNTRLNQIETELSRLRSVVYLLVKDKPELLRLLGQDPSPS